MASTLRVDPRTLRATSDAFGTIAAGVAGVGVAQTCGGVAAGLPGLSTGSALEAAGATVDEACRRMGEELHTFATNLVAAADEYGHTDEQLGGGISKAADTMGA